MKIRSIITFAIILFITISYICAQEPIIDWNPRTEKHSFFLLNDKKDTILYVEYVGDSVCYDKILYYIMEDEVWVQKNNSNITVQMGNF